MADKLRRIGELEIKPARTPPGPTQEYRQTDDLLEWMGHQFNQFGDTFKASVYGTSVLATRDI